MNHTEMRVMSIEDCLDRYDNLSLAMEEFNVSCLPHAPTLTHQALIRAIVLAAMSILSLVGNVATILVIAKDTNRTSMCTLVLHLSVADLFVSLFCLAGESVWTYTVAWHAGNIMCKFVKYWQMFGLYLSTYLVVVIGLDRWIAISKPLMRQSGKSRTRAWTYTAWILSALFSLPQFLIFRVSKGPFLEEFYQCVTYGAYTAKWQEQLYSILSLLLMFIIPLVILIVTYSSAIVKLRESERSFQFSETISSLSHAESHRQKRMRKATKRSLQMSLYIVGGFLLCWIPYYTLSFSLLFGLAPEEYGEKLMQNIFFFGMSNSLINPVIYGAFHLWRPKAPAHHGSNTCGGLSVHTSRSTIKNRENGIALRSSFLRTSSPPTSTKEPSNRYSGEHHMISSTNSTSCRGGGGVGGPGGGKPPPVTRCNTADVPSLKNGLTKGSNGQLAAMGRCATIDCTTVVDRKKASLKRRQIMKGRLYAKKGALDQNVANFDYSQEILGIEAIGKEDHSEC